MAEQHGKTLVPQIRFAGFTDPWEQRKLGELTEIKDSARIPNRLWVKLVFPIFEQVTYLKKISEVRSLLMKKTMPLTKRLLGHQKKEMFYSMEV